jgi:hypothetical protein
MNQAFKLDIVNKADFTYTESEDMIDEIDIENIQSKVSLDMQAEMRRFDFNIFEFSDKVGRNQQMPLVAHSLLRINQVDGLVNTRKFLEFMKAIYNRYSRGVAYHNDLHGSDVALQTSYILNMRCMNAIGLNDYDKLSLLVAALAHDVGHDGFSNQFHMNARSKRFMDYGDLSVQEGYHAATTILLLEQQ